MTVLFACGALGVVLVACSNEDLLDIPLKDLEGTSPTDEGNRKPSKKKDASVEEDGEWQYEDRHPLPKPAEGECKDAPKLLDTTPGFWCDFLDKGKGGLCQADETCCNPGRPPQTEGAPPTYATSYCAKTPRDQKGAYPSAACKEQAPPDEFGWVEAGATTWECADSKQCGDGQKCCLGSVSTEPGKVVNLGPWRTEAVPATCDALQAYKNTGTHCADACPKPEIQLCDLEGKDCKEGQQCVPFHAFNRKTFGYCKAL